MAGCDVPPPPTFARGPLFLWWGMAVFGPRKFGFAVLEVHLDTVLFCMVHLPSYLCAWVTLSASRFVRAAQRTAVAVAKTNLVHARDGPSPCLHDFPQSLAGVLWAPAARPTRRATFFRQHFSFLCPRPILLRSRNTPRAQTRPDTRYEMTQRALLTILRERAGSKIIKHTHGGPLWTQRIRSPKRP